MNLTRKDDEDYTTFVSVVIKHCDGFKLSELSANNFECLIFVQGLESNKDVEIRRRVLNILENEPYLMLQQFAEDCQRFVSVRQDSKDIEENGVSYIEKYSTKNPQKTNKTSHQINRVNWRKNKVFGPLNRDLAAGIWIDIRTTNRDLKSVWFAIDSGTKAHTEELITVVNEVDQPCCLCYIKRRKKINESTRILSEFQNLLYQLETKSPHAVSRANNRRKELLMSEQKLNIQFEASRIRWSRRDEQMMKQRSINWMCSPHVEWWSAAGVREKERIGLSCSKNVWERDRARVFTAFYIVRESHPGRMGLIILIGRNMRFETTTVKMIPALNNNLKFFLLQTKKKNSFVEIAKTDESEGLNIRKIVQVKVLVTTRLETCR